METTTPVAKLSVSSPEFVAWLAACKEMGTNQLRDLSGRELILEAEEGSKFIRVWQYTGSQRLCWAFVAREDTTSKALGSVKRGDILKPATWKAPAKHARGNIFHGGTGGVVQWTGPSYL